MRGKGSLMLIGVLTLSPLVGCSDRLALDHFPLTFEDFEGSDEPAVEPPGGATPLGLLSAVGGDETLRIEWRAPAAAGPQPEMALLITDESGGPSAGAPLILTPGTMHLVVDSLPNGHLYTVTLGVAGGAGGPYLATGPTLSVRTGAPIYVDIDADPGVADGSTPATAYDDLILAVLLAFTFGGGNVWVAEGDYTNMSLPLFDGVDIYGGFPKGFALEDRDTDVHVTRLVGLPELPVASLQNTSSLTVFDGFELVGEGLASIGLEVEDAPFEGRRLRVSGCKRGIKFRRGPLSDSVEMYLTSSSSRHNQLQGLSGEGPLELFVDGCSFSGNGQEGFELAGWLAPDGLTVRLQLRDCDFTGNGGEGADIDMIAPFAGGTSGGRFELQIESCTAQTNALAGLLVDIDYESAPLWSAEIALRGCYVRGNGGAGVHLDLDSHAAVLVQRLAATANRAPGLFVSSETRSGSLTVCASAFVGNQGAGILSQGGNFGLLASQCLFSGNGQGGLVNSFAPAAAVSSVAYLQASAWVGSQAHYSPQQDAPDPAPFVDAPRGFAQILAASGGLLTLDRQPASAMDAIAEVSDDGVAREVLSISGSAIQVDPMPAGVVAPHPVAFFAPGSDAQDDYELSLTSIALDAGLPPIEGGTSDAGPHGVPAGGTPGSEDVLVQDLFFLLHSTPPWVHPVAADDELVLSFAGGTPDPVAAPLFVQVVDADATPLLATAWVADDALHVAPPAGGWPQGATIQLHRRLPSIEGAAFASPVVIPLQVL